MRQGNSSEASVTRLVRAGGRYLLLLAFSVGALLLAPGAVRLGPSEREISDTEGNIRFWRKLVDSVGPTEAAFLPHHRHSMQSLWLQDVRILNAVEAERVKRQLAVQDPYTRVDRIQSERERMVAAMDSLDLPEVVSHDALEEEARRREHADFELKSIRLGTTLGMLLLLLAGLSAAWLLARRGQALIPAVECKLLPSTRRQLLRGLSRSALVAAAIVAGGAVAWLLANLKWSPGRGLTASFAVLVSCVLLVQSGLRLRRCAGEP